MSLRIATTTGPASTTVATILPAYRADSRRQCHAAASIDRRLNQARCKECERYRHIDLSNAALFAFCDLLDVDGVSGDNLVQPMSAFRNGGDKLGTGLGPDRSVVGSGSVLRWPDDFPRQLRWFFGPGNEQGCREGIAMLFTELL